MVVSQRTMGRGRWTDRAKLPGATLLGSLLCCERRLEGGASGEGANAEGSQLPHRPGVGGAEAMIGSFARPAFEPECCVAAQGGSLQASLGGCPRDRRVLWRKTLFEPALGSWWSLLGIPGGSGTGAVHGRYQGIFLGGVVYSTGTGIPLGGRFSLGRRALLSIPLGAARLVFSLVSWFLRGRLPLVLTVGTVVGCLKAEECRDFSIATDRCESLTRHDDDPGGNPLSIYHSQKSSGPLGSRATARAVFVPLGMKTADQPLETRGK